MRKKLAMITAAVALGAFLVVGGTLAWFTATDTATNTITTGNVAIKVSETVPAPDTSKGEYWEVNLKNVGEETKALTYSNITPGTVIPKNPTITYTGDSRGYVRYSITVNLPEGSGAVLNETVKLKKNGDEIVYKPKKDGYVYLPNVWTKDSEPLVLFDSVEFTDALGNSFAGQKNITIVVKADTVQADNLPFNADAEKPWGDVKPEEVTTVEQ